MAHLDQYDVVLIDNGPGKGLGLKAEEFGEIQLAERPEKGWDVLAIIMTDVPFSGYVDVPVFTPYSSGGGSMELKSVQHQSTRRVPMFLMSKSKDQSVVERDAKIEALQKANAILNDDVKLTQRNLAIEQGEHASTRKARDDRSEQYYALRKENDKLAKHVEAALKALGEVKWREIIGQDKP